MEKTIKLYRATQKVWGATYPRYIYFDTKKERDEFVSVTDYTNKAGFVMLTSHQYDQWKRYGDWDRYAE